MQRVFLTCSIITLIAANLYADSVPETVRFNRDIRPILAANCLQCHGPDGNHREADLRIDHQESATADRDGSKVIHAGNPTKSLLWQRITSDDPDTIMPPPDSKKQLTDDQIAILKKWIEQGAEYEQHWSFTKPESPTVPKFEMKDRVQNPIDAFILFKLNSKGLEFSEEAAKEILIRRATFDLTGLPPTLKEVDAFLADVSDNAYEKLIDRLLASKSFGERMALPWMDAARYGDSSVFHADGPRDMWPWRDWVIDAYNNNKSFKDFTVEQIAGDLLPNPTVRQQIASGFFRNNGTTDEGGAIDEEYRVEYAIDRVKTTSTVWMGMTMECAQCHDHKYEPITQREYYQFFAFFNQSMEKGMQTRNGNAEPKIDVPNFKKQALAEPLRKKINSKKEQLAERAKQADGEFKTWLTEASTNARPTTIPDDSYVWFKLDEGKSRQLKNSGSSKTIAALKGKPKWTDGHSGKCLQFDGNLFADAGSLGDFERTDSFSYGAWLWTDQKATGAPIARMDNNNAYRGWDMHVTNRFVEVHIVNTWPTNAVKVRTKKQIKAKQWQHVFVTYDGSSKASGIKIYFDGVEQEWTIEQDGLKDTIRTGKPLYLGRRNPDSRYKGKIDDVRIYTRKLSPTEVAAIAGADPIAPILAMKANERNAQQNLLLRDYFLTTIDKPSKELTIELSKLQQQLTEVTQPISSVMVMRDVEKPRMTYILDRGNYASPKKDSPVEPATPSILSAYPNNAPKNRLGLARWLTADDNPLTARVTVNRYWQMLFGTGLVKTTEDFGSQGEWPSHLELLDWLAVDFVKNNWDIKRTLKQMMMSTTYRQTSKTHSALLAIDPANRLLAHGPRFRLEGEFVRDNALAVSGLLVNKVGGASVKPYQPPGLWNEVSLSGNVRFKQDKGENLYRRSMYTYWKRSAPAPALSIFDTPTREKCVVRRARTNTPLQALVTLNDPQFVEASRMLAERILKEGGETTADRIQFAYRTVTARQANDAFIKLLDKLLQNELQTYKADNEQAKALLGVGEFKRDESLDLAEHAAWTVISSLLLNLDETLVRS